MAKVAGYIQIPGRGWYTEPYPGWTFEYSPFTREWDAILSMDRVAPNNTLERDGEGFKCTLNDHGITTTGSTRGEAVCHALLELLVEENPVKK